MTTSTGPTGCSSSSSSSSTDKKEEEKDIQYAKNIKTAASPHMGKPKEVVRGVLPAEFVDTPRTLKLPPSINAAVPPLQFSSSSFYHQSFSATLPTTLPAAGGAAAAKGTSSSSSSVFVSNSIPYSAAIPTPVVTTSRVSAEPPTHLISPRFMGQHSSQYPIKWGVSTPPTSSSSLPVLLPSPRLTTGGIPTSLPAAAPAAYTAASPAAYTAAAAAAAPHPPTTYSPTITRVIEGGTNPNCPFQTHSTLPSTTYRYRIIDGPSIEQQLQLQQQPHRIGRVYTASPLLPMREMSKCTEYHGKKRYTIQPGVTTYVLPGSSRSTRRRGVVVGRRRSVCEDLVLPCLDTFIAALSKLCNCSQEFIPSTSEYPQSNNPLMMYQQQTPPTGDAVCLRCGAIVDSRAIGNWGGAPTGPSFIGGTSSYLSAGQTQTKPDKDGRIPLPVFPYSNPVPQLERKRKEEKRGGEDAASRTARIGRLRSSALGYPTDDEGLVALPAFTLAEAK